jgi:hypothetical protein
VGQAGEGFLQQFSVQLDLHLASNMREHKHHLRITQKLEQEATVGTYRFTHRVYRTEYQAFSPVVRIGSPRPLQVHLYQERKIAHKRKKLRHSMFSLDGCKLFLETESSR